MKNRTVLDQPNPGDKPALWLGIYAKRPPLSWFGFKFVDINESPKLKMMVEGLFPGNITSEKLKGQLPKTLARLFEELGADLEHLPESNESILHLRQPIEAEYNGDADKMYEWLLSAAKEFTELQPRKR